MDVHVIAPTPPTIAILLDLARIVLHKFVLEQTQRLDRFSYTTRQLLEFVFDAIPKVKESLPDTDFDKPLIPGSDGSSFGLYRVLTYLFTTPHTIHSLLNYFIEHPDHLLITSNMSCNDGPSSFPNLVSDLRLSRELQQTFSSLNSY